MCHCYGRRVPVTEKRLMKQSRLGADVYYSEAGMTAVKASAAAVGYAVSTAAEAE